MPYDIPAMKACALAIVLVVVGCGSRKPDGAPDVDRYINTELAPYLARALAARAGYGDISADDFEQRPSRTRYRIRDAALPLLGEALDGASKLVPPAGARQLHDDFLVTLRAERDAIAEMAAAFEPPDGAKFRSGHAKMMDAQDDVSRWERTLDHTLAANGLKLKPLPDVKIPEPVAEPAPAAPPPLPAACKAGTAKVAADRSVACESEYIFAPPETVAGTPKESVVVCGAGPITYGPDGAVTSCVLRGSVVIGSETIPRGSQVVLGPKARVMKAVLEGGKGLCFDDEARSKPCP